MRLKKLIISGFKSFAERTVLHFDAGISCIVGPNGCGKSNIADAFRWVLGEQSAKSMRGNKMPDVIFAGSNSRKPLNFAEVSLTLTDIQGAIPIEYEEVTITRRLHRSGESEYFLNGNPVRLKDIQSLFLDSGVGRNAFSIFEQGKLDQVISYTPIERRHIFEEAAGILRFLQRKREALKRLELADQNWSRIKDIHQEVEKQIQTLQIQAEKALLYKENKIQFERLEKASYYLRWQGLQQKTASVEAKNQQLVEKLGSLTEGLDVWQEKLNSAKGDIQTHEKGFRVASEELFRIRNAKEMQLRDRQALEQRMIEVSLKEKKLKKDLEELQIAHDTRLKELQDLNKKQKQVDTDYSEAEKKVSHHHDRVKQKEKEVVQLRQDLHAKQQSHLKALQQESQMVSETKQAEVRLENSIERHKQLLDKKQLIGDDLKQIAKAIQEKKKGLQEASNLVETHKEKLAYHEEQLKELAQTTAQKQKVLDDLQRLVMEARARVKVLLRMRDDHEGFSSGSKLLLQAANDKNHPLYKKLRPLYEFLEPEPAVAEAVAIVMRSYSDTLVVDTQKTLKAVIDYAEQKGLQDYSLVCQEIIEKGKGVKEKGTLLCRLKSHPIATHFLQDISLVATQADLIAQKEGMAGWSQQGGYIDQRGVFFKQKPSANQVFIREAELKSLEEELQVKEEQMGTLEKEIQQHHQKKSELQQKRAELDQVLRRDEMKLVEVNFALQRAVADEEKLHASNKQSDHDLQVFQEQIEQLKTLLKDLTNKHYTFIQDLKHLQQVKEDVQAEVEKQEASLRLQLQEHKEKGDHFQQLFDTKRQLQHHQNLLAVKAQDHDSQTLRLQNELAEAANMGAQFINREKEIVKALAALEIELAQTELLCANLEQECANKKEVLAQIEKEMGRQLEMIKEIEIESSQKQIQLTHHQAAAQALVDELLEKYQLSIEEARTEVEPIQQSLEQIDKQIRSLRQSLQAVGNVNLASIEDLEKQQARHVFLNQQMEDMRVSKDELLEIITQLDGESRKLFKETFEAIRTNFKKNFQILFSGGEADLQFTETDNILEAGIEISAKPPGKQMRSITLLSGGEKCLTAVALLFAIFEVKPAPFCILDEIDAPLDDANVDRFVNVVKHFVDRCQFLIITHNKRTMSIGDVLFGVSMEEKGVSKLLSLAFSHTPLPVASECLESLEK